MSALRFAGALSVIAVTCAAAATALSQDAFGDAAAITQFQRAVDSYAFQHLTINASNLPDCVLAVLPRLPEELEYRESGVVMILLDPHANMVVDVLHGAFPAR